MMQLRGYDIDYDDFCDVLYLMKHGEKSDRSVETDIDLITLRKNSESDHVVGGSFVSFGKLYRSGRIKELPLPEPFSEDFLDEIWHRITRRKRHKRRHS